jgi:hypothetical protein
MQSWMHHTSQHTDARHGVQETSRLYNTANTEHTAITIVRKA